MYEKRKVRRGGAENLSYFSLKSDRGKLKLWLPDNPSGFTEINCSEEYKIELKNAEDHGYQNPEKINEVNLTVQSNNQCTKNFSTVECNIELEAGKNLRWKSNFKPKVIFSAF